MQSVKNKNDDEIDLTELLSALWKGKFIVLALVFVCSAASVFYALSLPNIYRSSVSLTVAGESQGGLGAKLNSQFGGLAAMAGVNLGSGSTDKSELAIEIIKSRVFISEFITSNNLKAEIMATIGWDPASNTLIYDSDIYNPILNTWVREVEFPRVAEPSDQELYEKFISKHLVIDTDEKKRMTYISIFHVSPYVAKEIADKLVVAINNKIKQDDIAEANSSIHYLTAALQETSIADMQKIFYELIEQQEQTKMLANARDEYVFKVIDPAIVAELKDSPKRAVICVFGSIAGFVFGCMIVLVRFYFRR